MEFTEPKYLTPATGWKVTGRFEKSPKNGVGGLARVRAKNSSTPALEWGEFHWNETNFPGYGEKNVDWSSMCGGTTSEMRSQGLSNFVDSVAW